MNRIEAERVVDLEGTGFAHLSDEELRKMATDKNNRNFTIHREIAREMRIRQVIKEV